MQLMMVRGGVASLMRYSTGLTALPWIYDKCYPWKHNSYFSSFIKQKIFSQIFFYALANVLLTFLYLE